MTTPPGPDQDPNQHREQPPPGFPPAPPPQESTGTPPPGQYSQRWDQAPPLPPDQDRSTAPVPPTPIQVSFWIWIASAVLTVLGGLLVLTQRDELVEFARQQNAANLTEEQIQAMVNFTMGAVVFFLVVIGLLYVLFAFKMRAGRNWARIVLTALTVINLLGLAQGGVDVFGLVGVIAAVVAAVLMYLTPSTDYFNQVKQQRQAR